MTTYIPSLTLPEKFFTQPVISVLFPVALGSLVGVTLGNKDIDKEYKETKTPPLSPPGWVFGPVWITLYSCMGYAAYRAWTTGMSSVDPHIIELTKQGATLYTIQLGLNQMFMPLSFGLQQRLLAAVDIATLDVVVAYLIYIWSQIDTVAAWLLVPYLAWISFATYLETAIVFLNGPSGPIKRRD